MPAAAPDAVLLDVKASLDPTASATRLAELLDAHRFTTSLGFVRAGMPTINTNRPRAGWAALPSAEELFGSSASRPATRAATPP